MWKTILTILFPIHCLGCNQEGNFICFNCFNKLPLNTELPLDNLLISSYYKNPLIKNMIHRYKYDFVKELARPLGLLMVKKLNNFPNEFNKNNSILIPVPLHKKRLKWRGFNQSELLAQVISQELDIPVINNILIRTKYTLPQVKTQNIKQRKENMNQSFTLPKEKIIRKRFSFYRPDLGLTGKTIILIDDVSTTGATLKQAVQTLQPLQAKQIWKLVLARG